MIKRSYSIQLTTPAFLGGAVQSGEGRNLARKALLRASRVVRINPEMTWGNFPGGKA